MSFNQNEYISNFNKNNYKMYQFQVRKSDSNIIEYLDNLENRNNYLISLIVNDINCNVYTIKQIKSIIKPILHKYGITNINIFGSYARGEANENSDIDIFMTNSIDIDFFQLGMIKKELEVLFCKDVDLITLHENLRESFVANLKKDAIYV